MTPRTRPTLVVHTGGVGDFILACPALAHLAEEGPVELLGRPDRLALAVESRIATAAHDIDRVGFESVFSEPSDRLRSFLSRYDRAVVWMRDEGEIARAFMECGVGDVRTFPGLPPKGWTEHASRYYLSCLGIDAAEPSRLAIAPVDSTVDIIIHPGSGGRGKNWPMENFAELANELTAMGGRVSWSMGPAEEEMALPREADVIGGGSLVDRARLLAAARLYIGNDSGITHLAAACGCGTIAIFGPTDPRVWAPLGDHLSVVRGDPWPSVAEVLRAIESGAPDRQPTPKKS